MANKLTKYSCQVYTSYERLRKNLEPIISIIPKAVTYRVKVMQFLRKAQTVPYMQFIHHQLQSDPKTRVLLGKKSLERNLIFIRYYYI